MKPANLKSRYESICNEYIEVFCEKQDLEFDGWIGDIVGSIASFISEYFFNFDDITYDINTDQPKGLIMQWQDFNVEYEGGFVINYYSYSKGLRHHDVKPANLNA